MTSSENVGGELAIADTSLFIAVEQDRPLSVRPPERVALSVVTMGELWLGDLAARDGATRVRQLETLSAAAALEPPADRRARAPCLGSPAPRAPGRRQANADQ